MRNLSNSKQSSSATKLKRAWPSVVIVLIVSVGFYWSEMTMLRDANSPKPIYAAVHGDDSAQVLEEDPLFSDLSFFTEVKDAELAEQIGGAISSNDVTERFNQALAASQKNDLDLAISLYDSIIKAKPNHQMAAINLALMQQRKQQWDASLSTLERALKIAGGSRKGKIHSLIGKAYAQLDQYENAINHYKKSIEYRPSHVNTWRRLAKVSAQKRLPFDDVMSLYEKAIALEQENPSGYLEKAQYQFLKLDFEGVIETLALTDQILLSQKQLNQKDTLKLLSLLERGRMTKIKKQLLTQRTANTVAHESFFKALSALTEKRYSDAIEILSNRSKKVSEDQALALEILSAHAFQEAGEFEKSQSILQSLDGTKDYESLVSYKRALLQAEINTNASLLQAKVLLESQLSDANYQGDIARELSIISAKLGQSTEAYGYAELALSYGGEKRRFHYQRIEVERQFGSLEKAILLSENMAQKHPKSRSVLRQWAKSLSESGRVQEAIEKYRALTKNNERKSDLRALAKLLKASQQIEASMQVLETLLAKYSNDIEARYLFAENLCDSGKIAECETQANRVLRLDNNHTRAKNLIARLASTQTHG